MTIETLSEQEISILCEVSEEEPDNYEGGKKLDFERLVARGYIEGTKDTAPGLLQYKLTAKGEAALEQRNAGLNEA